MMVAKCKLICVHFNSFVAIFFRIFLVFEIRFSNFDSAQLAGGSEAEAQPTFVSWQMAVSLPGSNCDPA